MADEPSHSSDTAAAGGEVRPDAAAGVPPAAGKMPALPDAGAARPRRWSAPTSPARKLSNRTVWLLVAAAVLLVGILVVAIYYATSALDFGGSNPSRLSATEHKGNRHWERYAIRPPVYWHIQDHVENTSIVFKGPREDGYPPIIIVACTDGPGRLASHVQEHKARLSTQEKSVQWLSEEIDQGIDGCEAKRLEYDCLMPRVKPRSEKSENSDAEEMVKVRTLQYILEDPAIGKRPARFYRITCHVAEHAYARYLARFEACARSFRRLQRLE